MTEEEQQIAMAEECGWILVDDKVTGRNPNRSQEWYERFGNERRPDYLHDWNATHAAVNSLSSENRLFWAQHMNDITLRRSKEWFPARVATSTQAEWSEAFLRTVGRWT